MGQSYLSVALLPWFKGCPSFNQVTSGGGCPSASQSSRTSCPSRTLSSCGAPEGRILGGTVEKEREGDPSSCWPAQGT